MRNLYFVVYLTFGRAFISLPKSLFSDQDETENEQALYITISEASPLLVLPYSFNADIVFLSILNYYFFLLLMYMIK